MNTKVMVTDQPNDVILQALLDENADIDAKLAAVVGLPEKRAMNDRMIAIRRGDVPIKSTVIGRGPRSQESIDKGKATKAANAAKKLADALEAAQKSIAPAPVAVESASRPKETK